MVTSPSSEIQVGSDSMGSARGGGGCSRGSGWTSFDVDVFAEIDEEDQEIVESHPQHAPQAPLFEVPDEEVPQDSILNGLEAGPVLDDAQRKEELERRLGACLLF